MTQEKPRVRPFSLEQHFFLSQFPARKKQKTIFIPFELIRRNRDVVPLFDNDYELPVGVAMVVDLSEGLKHAGLMSYFFGKTDIPYQLVFAAKFTNAPLSDNQYEFWQYVRLSYSCFARMGRRENYQEVFSIYRTNSVQLIPRSQWFKFLDKERAAQYSKPFSSIPPTMQPDIESWHTQYGVLVLESIYDEGHEKNDEEDLRAFLYPQAVWLNKQHPKHRVIILEVDETVSPPEVVFRHFKTQLIQRLPLLSFYAQYRPRLRDPVKKKSQEIMLLQTEKDVNSNFARALALAYQEYEYRYNIKLSYQQELIRLIDLDGTSLHTYRTLGEFMAHVALNLVDRAMLVKSKY